MRSDQVVHGRAEARLRRVQRHAGVAEQQELLVVRHFQGLCQQHPRYVHKRCGIGGRLQVHDC